jgi:ribosomal protein S18 acetylase RimI-like enzyme
MITVRQAEPADATAIAALACAVHAMHANALPTVFQSADAAPSIPADVAGFIERAGPLFLVALRGGSFAGYARGEIQDEPATALKRGSRTLYVHEMGVAPEHRQHGVGRALLAAMRAAAVERGAQGVALDVYAFNTEARAFYAREGFTPLRERLVAPAETQPAAGPRGEVPPR